MYYRLANGEFVIDPKGRLPFTRELGILPSHGYLQYEVSNYAMDGYSCVHNLNTWKMNDHGFGPSACSISDEEMEEPLLILKNGNLESGMVFRSMIMMILAIFRIRLLRRMRSFLV